MYKKGFTLLEMIVVVMIVWMANFKFVEKKQNQQ